MLGSLINEIQIHTTNRKAGACTKTIKTGVKGFEVVIITHHTEIEANGGTYVVGEIEPLGLGTAYCKR
jgi:hypothetical protein